jgi:plasmid maintenance system antidote protein VapI
VPQSSVDIGLTANALAKAIGVPPNRITAILKAERGITGDTAIRLGTFYEEPRRKQRGIRRNRPANRSKLRGINPIEIKTSAEFWMNLQMTYDLRNAEKALPARVRRSIEDKRSVLA